MIKKLLLIAAFALPLFSADSFIYKIFKVKNGQYAILDKSNTVPNTPGIFPGKNYKNNWVGVYKKGASNDWENVLKWSWAKDLKSCTKRPNSGCIDISGLEVGEYDIRYFLNNSYTTDYSKTVKLEPANTPSFIKKTHLNNTKEGTIMVWFDATSEGDDTWIGIYEKGASNSWDNVIAWSWHNGLPGTTVDIILPEYLTIYEARLFHNNSYKVEATVEFQIDADQIIDNIYVAKQLGSRVVFETTTLGKGNKDWVGLYKIGASNSWDNVLAWSWVDVDRGVDGKSFSVEGLSSGEYELRLFYHNSYDVEAVKRVWLDF